MLRSLATSALLSLCLSGLPACDARSAAPSGEHLAAYQVTQVPATAAGAGSAHFVDFGGKLHLVGYELEPADRVGPGGSLKVTLYWRRVGALSPGWSLFTHLADDLGRQIRNYDRVGDFRAALASKPEGLAALELGKVYADVQSVEIPRGKELTPRVALLVGAWREWPPGDRGGGMRLAVVSGTANGPGAAMLGGFSTGVTRGTAKAPQK